MGNASKAALLADLASITVANGYSLTLLEVGSEPKSIAEIAVPAAFLIPGPGSSSDPETLTNLHGVETLSWRVQLVVYSDTPHDAIENAIRDVRNAVEKASSAITNVASTRHATVVSWTEPLPTEDQHNNLLIAYVTVQVERLYVRGSV